MILSEAVLTRFKTLLAEVESWKDLKDSQYVKMLATFINWAIEDAAFKVDRARQEAFIDTALNRSSILAHGESKEFMPRKPIPASGTATIVNQGESAFKIQRGTEFTAGSGITLTLMEGVFVPVGGSVEATFEQRSKDTFDFTVDERKPFYEILLDREISHKVVSFEVYVAEDGENYVQWKYDRILTNSYSDTLVFDEFYHFTDQIGIRFGNGDFGRIPPLGAKIRVDATVCEGEVVLMEGQTIWPTSDIIDENGQTALSTITVSTTIQHGSSQEGTEEMRRDLHYAPVYNERIVWENDYKYFLRRRYPDIVFAIAWGEETSEKMWGYKLENINKIYICAYSPERNIKEACLEALRDVPLMCRNFEWYEPVHVPFSLTVTGEVLRDCLIIEVKQAIITALEEAYGKSSRTRRDIVLLNEIYELITDTGFFVRTTGAWFEVEVHGSIEAAYAYQMLSIDIEATELNITYVGR